jgi:ribosomal protein L37AE/L43A
MASLQRILGINGASGKPLHLCPNCGAYVLGGATWTERVSDRRVRNVWSCETCGCEFETSAHFFREAVVKLKQSCVDRVRKSRAAR